MKINLFPANRFALLIILFISFSAFSFAQKEVNVIEHSAAMSAGSNNGFTVTIENMNRKEVEKILRAFMEQYGKKIAYAETSKTELKASNVLVPVISDKPVDIYFLFNENNDGTELTGFFKTGDNYIASATQPVKYKDAENFMRRIALRVEKLNLQDQLAITQKAMGKSNDEQKDLERKNQFLNKDISDCNTAIEKAKAALEQNAKDQEAKKTEIGKEQKNIEDLNSELGKYKDY